MPDTKKFYLTTPIYYVNARPHIGHAYSTIVADVLARRHRLLGDDTYFLTGTDEHGQKIERSAAAAGVPPQQFADQVSKTFSDLWKRMGITNDQFIRTTDPKHKAGVQKLFATLYDRGHIYLDTYTGSYCVSDEAFVDAPVGTPCPDCGRLLEEVTEENFFFRLSKFQENLVDLIRSKTLDITPDSARKEVFRFVCGDVQSIVREYWDTKINNATDEELTALGFSRAGALTMGSLSSEQIEEAYLAAGSSVAKSPMGVYYIPGALKDLSISRSSFTWGIPVPEEVQKAAGATQKHVIYVWLDALANYMTALGYGGDDDSLWQKFWPADLHLVGKEITRFHCVYWPAFLMAAGLETPKQVTANGWLLFDNSKMSKSKGNVIRAETILDAFGTLCPPPVGDPANIPQRLKPEGDDGGDGTAEAVPLTSDRDRDLFAADVLRYYLLREIPFGQDGSFSFESLILSYNADLANGFGNLVSRTLNLIKQNLPDGVPEAKSPWLCPDRSVYREAGGIPDSEERWSGTPYIMRNLGQLPRFADNSLWPENKFRIFLAEVMLRVTFIDGYISFNKPWALAKSADPTDKKKLVEVLYTAAESIRIITALLYPILPYATAMVWKQLGFEKSIEQAAADGELKNLQWGGLKPGTKLGPLGPIFPRADKGLAQIMTDMEEQETGNRKQETPATAAPDAAPRTASLAEPSGTLTVGGSVAHTTGADASIVQTPPSVTTAPADAPTESTPQIGIDDFAKIDLRVAQIVLAERIPKADKLLRLEVDLGPMGRRQILSGIAEFYTPEELTGRRIVVIANLAPRKMRGLESHGMLLAASDGDHGKPHLATCGDEIALGARLK
jgi:methionyl-tRNA synthetase